MASDISTSGEADRRLSKADRRAQLVEIAKDLYNKHDYDAIGVKDVARVAGVSHGLIYHYFPSKEALFLAAVHQGVDELVECIGVIDPEVPLVESTLRGIAGYLDFVEAHEQVYYNLYLGPVSQIPELQALRERGRRAIADMILAGLPAELDMDLPATHLFLDGAQAFVERTVLKWLPKRELPRGELEIMYGLELGYAVKRGLQLDIPKGHPLYDIIEPLSEEIEQALESRSRATTT